MLSGAACVVGGLLTGTAAGALIEQLGYVNFYLFTTAIALPGVLLFWLMMRAGLIDASVGSAARVGGHAVRRCLRRRRSFDRHCCGRSHRAAGLREFLLIHDGDRATRCPVVLVDDAGRADRCFGRVRRTRRRPCCPALPASSAVF